jgi:hypothetical protein
VSAVPKNFSFHAGDLPRETFLADVLEGLSRARKTLPPKYFYDARGCALFEAICELPEYYLTRAETALMRAHASEMARISGRGTVLVEYGSGNSRKTRILLDALAPSCYVPVDIACDELKAGGRRALDRASGFDRRSGGRRFHATHHSASGARSGWIASGCLLSRLDDWQSLAGGVTGSFRAIASPRRGLMESCWWG